MKNKKIGDIVLFSDDTRFMSRAISKVTGSRYTHVGIVSKIYKDSVEISEALNQGFVTNLYYDEYLTEQMNERRILILRTRRKLTDVNKYIDEFKGTSYGFLQLLGILIRRYTGLSLFENGERQVICSEVVARVLYKATNGRLDISKIFKKDFEFITPGDIYLTPNLVVVNENYRN